MKLPPARYEIIDVDHKYTILMPNGNTIGPLKSVTSVLDVMAKPALIGWAARETASFFKAEILRMGTKAMNMGMLEGIAREAAQAHRRKAKDAADLGTQCHAAFEAIIKGKEPADYPMEISVPVAAFKNYRLQSDIEIMATEMSVGSIEHRYGGRLDFLGYSASRGGWGIGDYKTSGAYYNQFAFQAGGGYALAVEEMYGIKIAWAEIVRFSKRPPYESEARPVTNVRAAIDGFLSALNLVRINELKLIGEPTFSSAGIPEAPKGETRGKRSLPTPLPF